MKIVKADISEIKSLVDFYENVIENTKHMEKYGRWKKGLYPRQDDIEYYIEKDAMYMLIDDTADIEGAMAITMGQGEAYNNISWNTVASDNEVAVIHILAVLRFFKDMELVNI